MGIKLSDILIGVVYDIFVGVILLLRSRGGDSFAYMIVLTMNRFNRQTVLQYHLLAMRVIA